MAMTTLSKLLVIIQTYSGCLSQLVLVIFGDLHEQQLISRQLPRKRMLLIWLRICWYLEKKSMNNVIFVNMDLNYEKTMVKGLINKSVARVGVERAAVPPLMSFLTEAILGGKEREDIG